MSNRIVRASCVAAIIFFAAQTLIAQGILIGPFPVTDSRGRSRAEQCNDFCRELVYDCNSARPVGEMCAILTEPPPRDVGIAIKTPSKAECDELISAYPNDFNSYLPTPASRDGWCYQNHGVPLSGVWGGGGWGTLQLQASSTSISGSYDATFNVSGRKKLEGAIDLRRTGSSWSGTWDDPNIGRGGDLSNVEVSADGKTISGKYTVTRTGGKSSAPGTFTWTWKK